VPAPSGRGSGRGPSPWPRSRDAGGTPALPGHVHRAVCAPRMGPDVGETGLSPHPRPRKGLGVRRSILSLFERSSFPTPPHAEGFGRAKPSGRSLGKPGFPGPASGGRCERRNRARPTAAPAAEQPARRSRYPGARCLRFRLPPSPAPPARGTPPSWSA